MNNNEKLLVIGASGLLGRHIVKFYEKKASQITAIFHAHDIPKTTKNLTTLKLDILDEGAVKNILKNYCPDLIIHCAGITNVDYCEENKEAAYKVNGYSVKPFAAYTKRNQAKFVYISTDHLFDGKQALSTENTSPDPQNIYAKSKLLGEEITLSEDPESLIIRTNFFGKGMYWRQSFTDWLWSNLKQKKDLELFRDSFFTPIALPCLISFMNQLLEKNAHSIFNVCGRERISKFDFAIKFSHYFGLDPSTISSSTIQSAHLKAPRPYDMSLSTQKLRGFLNMDPPSIDESFDVISSDYQHG